ncbi:MAG: twin-arginine translocation signal domain-containing protein, partial [Cyclobacteriaceae bacterium]|nr:twin-arginine translocation signal domain-containing protein [Cyclobacteriaceae bacterium]
MKKYKRRHFIKTIGATAMASALPGTVISNPKESIMWGNLLHLSFNMWEDWD